MSEPKTDKTDRVLVIARREERAAELVAELALPSDTFQLTFDQDIPPIAFSKIYIEAPVNEQYAARLKARLPPGEEPIVVTGDMLAPIPVGSMLLPRPYDSNKFKQRAVVTMETRAGRYIIRCSPSATFHLMQWEIHESFNVRGVADSSADVKAFFEGNAPFDKPTDAGKNPILPINTMLYSRDPWARGNAVVMSHRLLANGTPVYSIRTQRSAGYDMTLDDIVANYEVAGIAEDASAFLRLMGTPASVPVKNGMRVDIRMNGKPNIAGGYKGKITLRDQSGAVIALSGVNMVSSGLGCYVTIGLQAESISWENCVAVDDAVSSVLNHGPCGVCGKDVNSAYPWIIRGKPMHEDCFKRTGNADPAPEKYAVDSEMLKEVRLAKRVEVDGVVFFRSDQIGPDGARYFENHLQGTIGDGAVVVRISQGRARIIEDGPGEPQTPKHYVAVVGRTKSDAELMKHAIKHLPADVQIDALWLYASDPDMAGRGPYREIYVDGDISFSTGWLDRIRRLPGVRPQRTPEVGAYRGHDMTESEARKDKIPWLDSLVPKDINSKEVIIKIGEHLRNNEREKDEILRLLIGLDDNPILEECVRGLKMLAKRARKVIST